MTSPSVDPTGIPRHLADIPQAFQTFLDSQSGNIADWSLQGLLEGMKLAFDLSKNSVVVLFCPSLKGFDENLRHFSGGYVFGTKDGAVRVSAVFEDEKMTVVDGDIDNWDLKILFTDVPAFWDFILSGGNDILKSIMRNDVEAYGNLNFLYKFAFMTRDLKQRLGLDFKLTT